MAGSMTSTDDCIAAARFAHLYRSFQRASVAEKARAIRHVGRMDDDLLRATFDHACQFTAGLEQRPVRPELDAAGVLAKLPGGAMPERGLDAKAVIAEMIAAAEGGLVASVGPRYFGFVIGGTLPAALCADVLTSVWDQNACLHETSPAAAAFEQLTAQWLLDLLGLPRSASVGLVTGGQMANFTGLAAGRNELLRRVGWDLEQRGLGGAPRLNVIASEAAHATIFAALRMLGIGRQQIRSAAADEQGRMRIDSLADALGRCEGPTLICAQAGNVNTGAFDPVGPIAELAHARGAWLHVDGAFGLWAAASPTRRRWLAGVEAADSFACDGHKWLNVPYDCGFAIVADPAAHRSGVANARAPYLVTADSAGSGHRDNQDYAPEASRRARAFPVYAALRALGREGIAQLIDGCCDHAVQIAERIARHPDTRILNDVVLNQVLIRFEPEGSSAAQADAFTRAVIERVQRDGTCWAGPTIYRGQAAMRIAISNWRTSAHDIDLAAASIAASAVAVMQAQHS
jgi:glutamate/tyrosine decarboxylase-like PLP-dependent enzyme